MILLESVRLVNWYGFNHITVPSGYFSLIAGKNGNGKSVLLDAVKYDIVRLQELREMELYADTIRYMMQNNVKLEQEIISLELMK